MVNGRVLSILLIKDKTQSKTKIDETANSNNDLGNTKSQNSFNLMETPLNF